MCFKLSNPTNGISSRCYYNETTPTKYLVCTSGWKPIKNFPDIMKNLTIIGSDMSIEDYKTFEKGNLKYGTITIWDKGIGPDTKLAEYTLEDNTDLCPNENCYAKGNVTLWDSGKLFDTIEFKNIATNKLKNVKNKIYLVTYKDYQIIVNDYKKECYIAINGSNVCGDIFSGTHKETRKKEIKTEYKGQSLSIGTYNWKIEGQIEKGEKIDWIATSGIGLEKMDNWAWWESGISNCTNLQRMTENMTADYFLNNDINCSGTTSWKPIGNTTRYFSGTFDGKGYTIYGFAVSSSTTGIFGIVNRSNNVNQNSISNVKIANSSWTVGSNMGILIGQLFNGIVSNISIDGCFASGAGVNMGLLIGNLAPGNSSIALVQNVYAFNSSINGGRSVGGLIGQMQLNPVYSANGTIRNAYFVNGNISCTICADRQGVGGIVGGAIDYSDVYNVWVSNTTIWSNNDGYAGIILGSADKISLYGNFSSYNNTRDNINTWIGQETVPTAFIDEPNEDVYQGTGVTSVIPMENWDFTKVWKTTSLYPILRGGVSAAPIITFLSQQPADITITNLQVNKLFINYSVTSATLNDTTVKLWYKSNDTLSNVQFFLNGTAYSGYFDDSFSLSVRTNISEKYTWTLLDNEVYPGTFNTDPVKIDNKVHDNILTTNIPGNQYYVKTQYYNISNTSNWGYFEIMANSTPTANPASVYYCNNSYTTGRIDTNPNCALTATRTATTTFDHCHTNSSCHLGFQFAINQTSGKIGNVKVTSTSWFIFGGANNWRVYNIPEITRAGMTLSTTNRGTAWSAQTYTVDEHLHQFDTINTNTTFYYYVCANNTDGTGDCSAVRKDLMAYTGLPPTSPQVYNPIEGTYKGNITINYTASESPNEYEISYYNISLLNIDFSFNKTIQTNNSLNLSFVWDLIGTTLGEYVIRVEAKDILNQTSEGYSDNFTLGYSDIDYNVILPLGFIRFLNCSPDFENPVSIPQGQNSTFNSINATNNGTVSSNLQIRINQTAATGWTLYASNQSDLSQNLTLSTSWQTIYGSVNDLLYRQVWLFANCSFINSNARTSIEMQAV
jgi:hypothetical protein